MTQSSSATTTVKDSEPPEPESSPRAIVIVSAVDSAVVEGCEKAELIIEDNEVRRGEEEERVEMKNDDPIEEDVEAKVAVVFCIRLKQSRSNLLHKMSVTELCRKFREEVFGPVAPLLRFKMAEEATSIANDTNAGAYSDSRGLPGIRKEGRCTCARMMIFGYGALLREWASELLSKDLVQSATLSRRAAGVYHHLANEVLPSLQRVLPP